MGAIPYSLNKLYHVIPRPVLELAFFDNYWMLHQMPQSLDSLIKAKVIMNRVMTDISLFSGNQIVIPLQGLTGTTIAPYQTIYNVPKHLTQGRTICNIIRMDFLNVNNGMDLNGSNRFNQPYLSGGSNHIQGMNQAIYQTNSPSPAMSTPFANIIAENQILVCGEVYMAQQGSLVAIVGYDDNASSLQPAMYQLFARMVELAVKAYIWVNMVVSLDRGAVYGGYQIGVVKDIIDEYKDANELYEDLLDNTWKAASMLDDLGTSAEFIQMHTPR